MTFFDAVNERLLEADAFNMTTTESVWQPVGTERPCTMVLGEWRLSGRGTVIETYPAASGLWHVTHECAGTITVEPEE